MYHIKPLGSKNEIIREDADFTSFTRTINFSKRPASIRRGDFLIAYAVGSQKIITVYRVESKLLEDKENSRYPYCFRCLNVIPKYSKNWSQNNLYLNDLIKTFNELYPEKNVTTTKKDLNALRFGHSSLILNMNFAKFVIEKMTQIEYLEFSSVQNDIVNSIFGQSSMYLSSCDKIQIENLTKKHFKHFKGNIYELVCIAVHSETNENLVIYKDSQDFYARPADMFFESVEVDGVMQPRFQLI